MSESKEITEVDSLDLTSWFVCYKIIRIISCKQPNAGYYIFVCFNIK